eukprot:9227778-Lingulodinium_polyedra.AAC.1
MGPDVVAGVQALQRKYQINLDFTPDTSHGVRNDIWLACKDAGLKSLFYMLLLTINIPMGHWCEDVRYQQVIQGLAEMMELESPHCCPLFQELLPAMVAE